jgi:hypothetical protein
MPSVFAANDLRQSSETVTKSSASKPTWPLHVSRPPRPSTPVCRSFLLSPLVDDSRCRQHRHNYGARAATDFCSRRFQNWLRDSGRFAGLSERMMGLEPTTFCMAKASGVRARSRPFAQTALLRGPRPSERTPANPSERRTLPFLPRFRPSRACRRSLITTLGGGLSPVALAISPVGPSALTLKDDPSGTRRSSSSSSADARVAGAPAERPHGGVEQPRLLEVAEVAGAGKDDERRVHHALANFPG